MNKVEIEPYLIFVGTPHYPLGGNEDFFMFSNSIESGMEFIIKLHASQRLKQLKTINGNDIWVSIVDSATMKTIKSGFYRDYKEEWEWQDGDFDHYKVSE